jgi:hypothetical protein
MATVTGKVIGGVVVVEGKKLSEGTAVTVVFDDDDEPYLLTPEEEAALEAAEREIDAGEYVTAEELMAELRRRRV